jgi:hypothetical protein
VLLGNCPEPHYVTYQFDGAVVDTIPSSWTLKHGGTHGYYCVIKNS